MTSHNTQATDHPTTPTAGDTIAASGTAGNGTAAGSTPARTAAASDATTTAAANGAVGGPHAAVAGTPATGADAAGTAANGTTAGGARPMSGASADGDSSGVLPDGTVAENGSVAAGVAANGGSAADGADPRGSDGDVPDRSAAGLPEPPAPKADVASVDDVEEAMRDVVDPELGINVVDLGLVYDIRVDDQNTAVLDMTLTSAACPLTDVIEDQARSALVTGPAGGIVGDVKINWVWMPPWGPEKITEDGREQLRALGFTV